MPFTTIPLWKEAPFIRITLPFILGIIIDSAFSLPGIVYWMLNAACAIGLISFEALKSTNRFAHYQLAGVLANVLLTSMGGLISSCNYSNLPAHPGVDLASKAAVLVRLDEPLTEKNKSFKALSSVEYLGTNPANYKATQKIILYFQKDPSLASIRVPSRIYFNQPLRPIINSGNPGAFDYKHYCAMQNIYHQVYLKTGDYLVLPARVNKSLEQSMVMARESIINILRRYIPGKLEAGLAEALLIGYKNDLDKDLLESYSQTGVVHVIAISGLHLGLIYWILNSLCLVFGKKKGTRFLRALLVISGLWVFTVIAGGAPSIMRSAVMFSFIAIGVSRRKKVSVYNSLALSAFVLLCYNPLWLADTGFQLSYIAVLSIVIFTRPLYNSIIVKNKILDHTWKLVATTIAAQILTTPIIVYYFNQFPNYFLLTNLVAIPLSSLIILAELLLCVLSLHPATGYLMGQAVFELIRMLNTFIVHISKMPFVTTDNLRLTTIQLALAYIIIAAVASWVVHKSTKAFVITMGSMCCFLVAETVSELKARTQQLLTVYNTPDQAATELIQEHKSLLICDTGKISESKIQNFVIRPAHNYFAVTTTHLMPMQSDPFGFFFGNKRILMINGPVKLAEGSDPITVDIVIVSGKDAINFPRLIEAINCEQVIFDGTVPSWKAGYWKTACKQKGIACYSVVENGAFILKLN